VKAIKKWAEGRPPIIEIIATQVATTAQDIHLAFRDIKSRKFLTYQFALPHFPSWYHLYRNHHATNNFLTSLFTDFSSLTEDQIELSHGMFDVFANWGKIDKSLLQNITQEDITLAAKSLRGLTDASYKDIENDLHPEPIDPEEQKAFFDFLDENNLQASFFILVHIPCWILYQMSPTALYRKARQGNIDSLDKLLRLDAFMIHDPAIGRQVQSFRFNRKMNAYRELMAAPLKQPKNKITRKKMKYLLSGFISAVAQACRHPLTEPEIRALYDAISQDAGRGAIDTDLPDSPDTFSKAIRRDKEFWASILQPDKTN
jgi:hypothetical protein